MKSPIIAASPVIAFALAAQAAALPLGAVSTYPAYFVMQPLTDIFLC